MGTLSDTWRGSPLVDVGRENEPTPGTLRAQARERPQDILKNENFMKTPFERNPATSGGHLPLPWAGSHPSWLSLSLPLPGPVPEPAPPTPSGHSELWKAHSG